MSVRVAAFAAVLLLSACGLSEAAPTGPDVPLPPAGAAFDYQIGGGYQPAPGVEVVSRDHEDTPVPGLYTICYVNAFQSQPGAESDWDHDLILRDTDGDPVMDGDWGEALLDVGDPDKRERIAAVVGGWIDGCAAKGFQAVEPDNYDSFTRSQGLLDADDAQAFIRLLSARAHAAGLAIGQKNASELSVNRVANGLDFAIAEECGEQDICDEFTPFFDNLVIVVEYTRAGLDNACAKWGNRLSVVQRDLDVLPADEAEYLRRTCDDL